MRFGITATITLAATLVFAIPLGLLGVQMLADDGSLLGGVLVVVAVLMVVLPQYLTTPGDIPGQIAGRVLGKAVKVPDEEEE
jgi:hypothetical protein